MGRFLHVRVYAIDIRITVSDELEKMRYKTDAALILKAKYYNIINIYFRGKGLKK
jgi:hypothetical protein